MVTELTLLLADGRWPGGGHAHSGGLEPAVHAGLVHDVESLYAFVLGRLHSAGPFEAWLAARACVADRAHTADTADTTDRADAPDTVRDLNARFEARTPSAAQRSASAALGRGLLRASARIWPELRSRVGLYQPVALGVVAQAAGLAPIDAARIAVHNVVMAPITAAPKVFAIDTSDALRLAVQLSPTMDACAEQWSGWAAPPPQSALSTELLAEEHATWSSRLFAS